MAEDRAHSGEYQPNRSAPKFFRQVGSQPNRHQSLDPIHQTGQHSSPFARGTVGIGATGAAAFHFPHILAGSQLNNNQAERDGTQQVTKQQ